MWPKLSSINDKIYDKIIDTNNREASNLNVWVRLFSGVGNGLIMVSNPDTKLFAAAGEGGIYGFVGDTEKGGYSGTLGSNWNGGAVNPSVGRTLRPSPIVTSMEFKEGEDQISRSGTIQIKAFSLEQLEAIQKYFMEPGYTLFVEWGWNTVEGALGLIKTNESNKIPSLAASGNLKQQSIRSKRVKTLGQYDSFLGFIVGGSVGSSGEEFDITIELRGTPELPTYLQTHDIVYESVGDSIKAKQHAPTFGPTDLENAGSGIISSETVVKARRFAKMYNELPLKRQIKNVRDLQTKSSYSMYDFINLDEVVSKSINLYQKNSYLFGLIQAGKATESVEVTVGGVTKDFEVDREKLFSKNTYIRFQKAIQILNENGGLESYKIGGKNINVTIDISNVVIGAFPHMFSTKPEVMVVPGSMPDFSKLLFNSGQMNYDSPPIINNSINGISFVQNTPLTISDKGFSEEAGYWGYLKNLYINLEFFNKTITQSQKGIREILLSLLNEMSTAVNSLWDFQIVEGESTDGETTVYTIIDRNWVGTPTGFEIKTFEHNGEASRFLDASLDIDIPGEMASAIISKRLKISSGKDIADVKVNSNTFFSNSGDKFLAAVTYSGKEIESDEADEDTTPPIEGSADDLSNQIETLDSEITANNEEKAAVNNEYRQNVAKLKAGGLTNSEKRAIQTRQQELTRKERELNRDTSAKTTEKNNKTKELNEKQVDEQISAIEGNIEKLEILPNPELKEELDVSDESLANLLTEADVNNTNTDSSFRKSFRIYCFRDTNLLEGIKKKKLAERTDRLSHPLPIKYSFTILGNSGLQRGNMFNINGIPAKYKNHGLFQISEITHTIEGMGWRTKVEGLYRQTQ